MVKIRLRRMGSKKNAFYRVVVADSRSPRDGRFIEELGYYNPLTDPATIKINEEQAKKWIADGAQPTETVRSIFKKSGIIDSYRQERSQDLLRPTRQAYNYAAVLFQRKGAFADAKAVVNTMAADLKKTLTDIARGIVDDPDGVTVTETVDGDNVCLELSVSEGDVGKVIGRHGRIAKAIRLLMKATAGLDGRHVSVEIK